MTQLVKELVKHIQIVESACEVANAKGCHNLRTSHTLVNALIFVGGFIKSENNDLANANNFKNYVEFIVDTLNKDCAKGAFETLEKAQVVHESCLYLVKIVESYFKRLNEKKEEERKPEVTDIMSAVETMETD